MGVWLDKKFGTAPWLTLIFLALGIVSGVKNAWYFIKKSMKAEEEKENNENQE
jgi:ATP synthase protein I